MGALVYKLTRQDRTSYGGMLWGEGVTHEAEPGDGPLCTARWLHYYEHPLLAVLHNPIHANIADPLLWEARAEGETLREGQMKAGCKRLTTVQVIEPPEVTMVQRVAYRIYCEAAAWAAEAAPAAESPELDLIACAEKAMRVR